MSTPTPTRNHIQELKSIRDSLTTKYSENQRILKSEVFHWGERMEWMIAKSKEPKLSRQITALNETIKYLETQIK